MSFYFSVGATDRDIQRSPWPTFCMELGLRNSQKKNDKVGRAKASPTLNTSASLEDLGFSVRVFSLSQKKDSLVLIEGCSHLLQSVCLIALPSGHHEEEAECSDLLIGPAGFSRACLLASVMFPETLTSLLTIRTITNRPSHSDLRSKKNQRVCPFVHLDDF